jgi:hypothetical protein
MSKRHLYWAFYKSTITLNYGISFMFALVAPAMAGGFLPGEVSAETYPEAVCRYFAYSIVFLGPEVAIIYKNMVRPSEYYFYYNQGISLIKLIYCCLVVNIPAATSALILRHYVAQT